MATWNASSRYIVVATTSKLREDGGYIVFEPSYRFTKYDDLEQISTGTEDESTLYKIRLPCPFNPFIYIFCNDAELSALDILGNAETDTRVSVRRQLDEDEALGYDPKELVDVSAISYEDIADGGELTFDGGKTESEFCRSRYRRWIETRYEPFYYHDDGDPKSQTRLVFTNEQTELDLARSFQTFCDSPRRTIHDFQNSVINFVVSLFDSSDQRAEIVSTVYRDCLMRLSPKQVFETIGHLVLDLKSQNHASEIHHVAGKRIYKNPHEGSMYEVEFRSNDLIVTEPSQNQTFTIAYRRSPVFQYEFLLLS